MVGKAIAEVNFQKYIHLEKVSEKDQDQGNVLKKNAPNEPTNRQPPLKGVNDSFSSLKVVEFAK